MTTISWSSTADAPAAPWAALLFDVNQLIAVAEVRGIAVTGLDGTGDPVLDATQIAIATQAPGDPAPTNFQFTRVANSQSVDVTEWSNANLAMVLAALSRAKTRLGNIFTSSTDATPQIRTLAGLLVEKVFGEADRLVSGIKPTMRGQTILQEAVMQIDAAGPHATLVDWLTALIDVLQSELTALTTP